MEVRFDGIKKSDPTNHDGMKVEYAGAKRTGYRWRWRFMLLIVVSPLLIWAWFFLQNEVLTRADGILTTEPIQIRASKSGFVVKESVLPGASVKAGQLVFDLSSPQVDRKITVWRKSRETLIAYREKMFKELGGVLLQYGKRLDEARQQQDEISSKYRQLKEKGLFTIDDQLRLNELRRSLAEDERLYLADLEGLESLRYTGDLAQDIRNIELEIAIAEVQQAELNIRADRDGVINRLYVKEGEYVTEGDPLFELSNYDEPVVNVFLRPERFDRAGVGNAVVFILPDGSRHSGVVSEPPQITETIPASLAGPFEGSKRAVKVIVSFDVEPENWVEGLPVKVRFK